jgi:hypothetical protein
MIIMSQVVNGKQKVSENNRPYATTATAKRFSSTYRVYGSVFRDINIGKGRPQASNFFEDRKL